jgi:hypothetical protein
MMPRRWDVCADVADGGSCDDNDDVVNGGVQLWGVRVSRLSVLIDLEI